MSTEPAWLTQLKSELEDMDPLARITVLGEWINIITTEVQPLLGNARRIAAVHQSLLDGWDVTRIAEVIGTRHTVIQRLVEEGRRLLRNADADREAE